MVKNDDFVKTCVFTKCLLNISVNMWKHISHKSKPEKPEIPEIPEIPEMLTRMKMCQKSKTGNFDISESYHCSTFSMKICPNRQKFLSLFDT